MASILCRPQCVQKDILETTSFRLEWLILQQPQPTEIKYDQANSNSWVLFSQRYMKKLCTVYIYINIMIMFHLTG